MSITRRVSILAAGAMLASLTAFADHSAHHSSMFQGPKANKGFVEHSVEGHKQILKVSEDFVIPDTPAPTWRVVDSKGNVYAVDNGGNRVLKFDGDGNFLGQWGSLGTGDGKFSSPSGIAIDGEDNIYIAERGNQRVQKFRQR